MEFNVYCDESYQDCLRGKDHNDVQYMVIGAIWLPKEDSEKLKKEIAELKVKHNSRGELKWSKVSGSRLDFYKDIIDLFWSYGNTVRFRCIIVDKDKIMWDRHDNDAELGFYKFYYQMLHHWIEMYNEYTIYCDKKINRRKNNLFVLEEFLEKANIYAVINGVYPAESKEMAILQFADFFIGMTAAKVNKTVGEKSPKMQLIEYLEKKMGRQICETYKSEQKFNVFKIVAGGGW